MAGMKKRSRTRQKNSSLRRHKRSVAAITGIIILLGAVVFVQGMRLQRQNQQYIAQKEELQAQLDEAEKRSEEIDSLKDYVGTDEYIEEIAKEKLGLVHENEILFRAEQ